MLLTYSCYSQGINTWLGGNGLHYSFVGGTLPILTPNMDTIWAGQNRSIASATDTGNSYNGTRELYMNRSFDMMKQTGTITRISLYIHDITKITSFKFKVWRPVNTREYTRNIVNLVATSEELVSLLANGVNNINLTTPIAVQVGDYYSVLVTETGGGITNIPDVLYGLNYRYFNSAVGTTTNFNWSTGTAYFRYYPIRFYMTAPVLTVTGNSLMAGTSNYTTGAGDDANRYFTGNTISSNLLYDIQHSLPYTICTYMGWTYQNNGKPSVTSTEIQTYFKEYNTDKKPRITIVEGWLNDAVIGGFYSATSIVNIKKEIDSCLVNDIIPIVHLTGAVTGYPDSAHKIADSVKSAIITYCNTLGVKYIVTDSPTGQFRAGGTPNNYWDFRQWFTKDNVHKNMNGFRREAREYVNYFKTIYACSDTARTYLQHTALTDTVIPAFPLYIKSYTSDFLGIDSVKLTYRINSGSSTSAYMWVDSSSVNGDKWLDTIAIDTSTLNAGDVLTYSITAYGYTTATTGDISITLSEKVWDVDYLALHNRRTVDPPFARQTIENDLIVDLRTAGTWTGMDWFWVGATDTIANSLYDWTVNANDPTAVNSPAFVENQGYTSSLAGAYINSGFALDVDAVNFTLNSSTLGLYIRTNVSEGKYDMGIQSTAYTVIISRASDLFYFNVNQGGHLTVANSDSRGLFGAIRTANNLVAGYRNNDSLKSGTNASTSIPSGNVYIGCRNNGTTAGEFATKQYAISFLGRGFTKTEWVATSTAINRYMTRIGSNVY